MRLIEKTPKLSILRLISVGVIPSEHVEDSGSR